MKRAAFYLRVSNDKLDLATQEKQLREFAERCGYEVALVFTDTLTGTGRVSRPGFESMMLAASQRKFDMLLFWALDRFSREGTRKTLTYLEQLRAWDVGYRSFMEPFLDTGNEMVNTIVLAVFSTIAKQEAIRISERVKAKLAELKKGGVKLGRPLKTKGKLSRTTLWRRSKQ